MGSRNVSQSSFASVFSRATQVLPWWPEHLSDSLAFHSMTQLPDGRLSIIVDPGAWTNLMGVNLARKLVERALAAGFKPTQSPMTPLNVSGVGEGSQVCKYKLETVIAVPHDDHESQRHKISTPIVEGSGANLPGLLGLRSLETDRAVLDTGNRTLIFPGPGDIKFELPPGSITIPLEKAPSGHLVMVIDDFEKLTARQTGGLKEHSLQFPTSVGEVTETPQAPNTETALPAVPPPPKAHHVPRPPAKKPSAL